MADRETNGSEPTELLYLPRSAWDAPLLAVGLGGVIVSLFTWWPYGVVGAIVALFGLVGWIRDSRRDYERLPRRQRLSTAVIPAVPLKRPSK